MQIFNIIEKETSVSQLIKTGSSYLSGFGVDTASLDSELLLSHAIGCKRIDLYTSNNMRIDETTLNKFADFLSRRGSFEPVAYILEEKEFWSIPIKVTNDVLIPRPETEHIVEETLKLCSSRDTDYNILDLCTGSGNITAALATELKNAHFVVSDISVHAIEIAKQNLCSHSSRVNFLIGDLFYGLDSYHPFDFITTNPPYGTKKDESIYSKEIKFEPEQAIFANNDGFEIINKILNIAPIHLKDGGYLIMEFGINQSKDISSLVKESGFYSDYRIIKDLAGIDRVLIAKK